LNFILADVLAAAALCLCGMLDDHAFSKTLGRR